MSYHVYFCTQPAKDKHPHTEVLLLPLLLLLSLFVLRFYVYGDKVGMTLSYAIISRYKAKILQIYFIFFYPCHPCPVAPPLRLATHRAPF